jgi:hypothetical protein
MTVVVRETIENDDTEPRAPQDKIFVIILRGFEATADKTVTVFTQALYVSDSPRRP